MAKLLVATEVLRLPVRETALGREGLQADRVVLGLGAGRVRHLSPPGATFAIEIAGDGGCVLRERKRKIKFGFSRIFPFTF